MDTDIRNALYAIIAAVIIIIVALILAKNTDMDMIDEKETITDAGDTYEILRDSNGDTVYLME